MDAGLLHREGTNSHETPVELPVKLKVLNFLDLLRESFWFIPSLMAFAAILLAWGMIYLDRLLDWSGVRALNWVYAGGAEGARLVLSAVATSIMTVTGVTFSITIAALSLASQQFGPRLLGNFTRDRSNQVVLGTFIATFIYCLLVLRVVRSRGQNEFVPHLAVTVGVILTLVSIGVLIYFIHHIAASIHVSTIVKQVGKELEYSIDRLYPTKVGKGEKDSFLHEGEADLPPDFDPKSATIPSRATGYVRSIDTDRLIDLATKRGLIFRLQSGPGDFIIEESPLAWFWPGGEPDESLIEQVNNIFTLGAQRTLTQDVEYAVHQLVEVAVRALSPGINDPFTAMTCVDRLGAGLCRFAGREPASPYRYDYGGKLRVIVNTLTFEEMMDAAFHQIRQYGRESVSVTLRLLETIAVIAPHIRREEDRAALLKHARLIREDSLDTIRVRSDRKQVEEFFQAAVDAVDEGIDAGA